MTNPLNPWARHTSTTRVSLDVMYSKPGIYVVVNRIQILFVETNADGDCFQLKPETFEHDGALARDGWNPAWIAGIFGPLARP